MKRVYISISDETFEKLRKQAFDERVQPGTLAAGIIAATVAAYRSTEASLRKSGSTAKLKWPVAKDKP